uniref:Uncharacterized protein n=1 Tax=Anguilla anguilla TaxID=7936 RepID=A0A0E9ULB9_ANGAN
MLNIKILKCMYNEVSLLQIS